MSPKCNGLTSLTKKIVFTISGDSFALLSIIFYIDFFCNKTEQAFSEGEALLQRLWAQSMQTRGRHRYLMWWCTRSGCQRTRSRCTWNSLGCNNNLRWTFFGLCTNLFFTFSIIFSTFLGTCSSSSIISTSYACKPIGQACCLISYLSNI